MYRDENGFLRLIKKSKISSSQETIPVPEKITPVEKKPVKESKPKKVKFKKGSWKYFLLKKLRHWRSSKFVKKFHFQKVWNLFILPNGKKNGKYLQFNEKVKNIQDPNSYLLINSYDGIYTRVSSKAYHQLCRIDKISLSFTLRGEYDDGEIFDVYQDDRIIDNVNDLMSFINQHRQGITGVYDMMSYCGGFVIYDFKFRIVVQMKDGEVKTYKSDMNDFMKEFGLDPF